MKIYIWNNKWSEKFLNSTNLFTAEAAVTSDDQQLTMVQGVVEQCMKRDLLLNETYLQLIKQTTDHPGKKRMHDKDQYYSLNFAVRHLQPL